MSAPTLGGRLQRLFLTGLLTLLPIWLTWIVVKFVFVLLSDISTPWVAPLSHRIAAGFPNSLGWANAASVQATIALLATIALILGVGWLARRVIGQRMLSWVDALVRRIPLANVIYSSARKLLDILQTKPDGTQRVVLIDFPHPGMKSVGFVTRVIREQGTGRELAAVYVPTTPNPTSGYLEIVPLEKITPTDWTVDQAMSFIISGGAVAPETIPFDPQPAPPHAVPAPGTPVP
ncbi:putative membrane protein [Luteimonas terrae]|uniref:Membrane protein n=2 Tax=Luteimonas terrae TaxID=1530191 RepID=A0ABU1XT91_9GAMM|nr:putative membrane protein [Luteimonas terrae]